MVPLPGSADGGAVSSGRSELFANDGIEGGLVIVVTCLVIGLCKSTEVVRSVEEETFESNDILTLGSVLENSLLGGIVGNRLMLLFAREVPLDIVW